MAELRYVEFHITDLCNLNCNGCSHFSPMVKKDTCTYASFKRDIQRLAELFSSIRHIRLLGGEPFLVSDISEYVITARESFPNADIQIVTNGLLIPNIDKSILFCIKDNNVSLDISLYPPTYERRICIKDRLESCGVNYSVSSKIERFRKRFCPNEQSDKEEAFRRCLIGRRCTFVHNGEIALCSAPIVVHHFNDYYSTEIVCADSTINIHEKDVTAEEILRFLETAKDSCKYCGELQEEKWSRCNDLKNIDASHWVTDIPIKNK